jgi:hypothetical protein
MQIAIVCLSFAVVPAAATAEVVPAAATAQADSPSDFVKSMHLSLDGHLRKIQTSMRNLISKMSKPSTGVVKMAKMGMNMTETKAYVQEYREMHYWACKQEQWQKTAFCSKESLTASKMGSKDDKRKSSKVLAFLLTEWCQEPDRKQSRLCRIHFQAALQKMMKHPKSGHLHAATARSARI